MRPTVNEPPFGMNVPGTGPMAGGGRSRKSSSSMVGTESFMSAASSGGGVLGGSTSSMEELHASASGPGPQSASSSMTYFLADESMVSKATAGAMVGSAASLGSSAAAGFGVQSLSSSGVASSGMRGKGDGVNVGAGVRRRSAVGIMDQRRRGVGQQQQHQQQQHQQHQQQQEQADRNDYAIEDDEEDGEEEEDKEEGLQEEEQSDQEEVENVEYEQDKDALHKLRDPDTNTATNTHPTPSAVTSPTGKLLQPAPYLEPPDSPFLGALRSPRSCDDFSEAASQAVSMGEEEEEDESICSPSPAVSPPAPRLRQKMRVSSANVAPPQFIMPTIRMPSRRPFTDRGKRVGRLKILVAGDSGIGKTSLIKSIVQTCEDIVHVDPVSTELSLGKKRATTGSTSSFFSISNRADGESTRSITEVYASTKPYPHWWSEHEDSRVLRRRKPSTAGGDTVLERNLCFVDTPGYGFGTSFAECVEPVIRYVESQMERTSALLTLGEGDLLSLLSGNGTPQVDVVLYVILHRLKPVDVEYIRRLSPLTNVLPVIAKADTLNDQQIKALKLSILSDLRAAGIRPFLFGKVYEDIVVGPPQACAPFAISSALSNDQENMDASILMSPDYSPPLVDTELVDLIRHIFDADNIDWLKHSTAKKYINWSSRVLAHSGTQSLSESTISSTPTPYRSLGSSSSAGIPSMSSSSLVQASAPNFTLARIADHTQREERLAQARLAKWANDLQRSLRAERESYERLAKGERAIWLTERLSECVIDGQLVPVSASTASRMKARGAGGGGGGVITRDGRFERRGRGPGGGGLWEGGLGMSTNDPLGVLGGLQKLNRGAAVLGYGGGVVAIMAAVWALKRYGYGVTMLEFTEWIGFHLM